MFTRKPPRYILFFLAILLSCEVTHFSGDCLAKEPKQISITDKTLVAWVAPADLSQQGSGVLSIFNTYLDMSEHFDAIVFGEKVPGKWMAGSDAFRRTQSAGRQQSYPTETADSKTFVQMAIVYQGKRVSIYRNARPYASYEIGQPHYFDGGSIVLIGLRYQGALGEIGPFAGTIEEARVYDVPLSVRQIAALKPNRPSDPAPLACWTFEDGTARDVMKTFPKSLLYGGGRIEDGKLHLNGKDAYVLAESERRLQTQGLFYKPRKRETGNIWDVWLCHDKGTYHLYLLSGPLGKWNGISTATSTDGVHWEEIGKVISIAQGAKWLGTGSTWKSLNFDNDGKFFMNFSEWRGPRQTIFFAESKDLVNWARLPVEYEFKQDERWYKKNGRWDCIWTVPRPGGGLYGYWTASPKPETGGRFGFGQTLDGVKWEALEPPKVHGVGHGEVGAVEKIGQKYYMMFGTGGRMVTLTADKPEGPFYAAKKNFSFLSGHTYFSRFFQSPEGLLANHHAIARNGQVYFSLLKSTLFDEQGTMRLGWWKGNDRLKDDAQSIILREPSPKAGPVVAMLDETLNADVGVIIEGHMTLPQDKDAKPVGLYVSHGGAQGTAILVHVDGCVELGTMQADGTGFEVEKKVDRQMDFGHTVAFRLVLKVSLLEFYLNDVLIECYSLPAVADGRIGLVGQVTDLKAWQLKTVR